MFTVYGPRAHDEERNPDGTRDSRGTVRAGPDKRHLPPECLDRADDCFCEQVRFPPVVGRKAAKGGIGPGYRR